MGTHGRRGLPHLMTGSVGGRFCVAPGQTAVIRLTPDRLGKMTFLCDLHPNVDGEVYLLDVPVE